MSKTNYLRNQMRELYHSRNYAEAAKYGEALLTEHWRNDSESPVLSDDLFNVALIYDEMGALEKAAKLYSASARHIDDNDFMGIAKRANNLAGVLVRMGGLEAAHHFYTQMKHIYQRYAGVNSTIYADSLYNLANTSAALKRKDEAIRLHAEALKIREDMGATEDMVNSLHSLAVIHEEAEEYEKAASYGEAALELADGSAYLRVCSYLAKLYEADGQHDKAMDILVNAHMHADIQYEPGDDAMITALVNFDNLESL